MSDDFDALFNKPPDDDFDSMFDAACTQTQTPVDEFDEFDEFDAAFDAAFVELEKPKGRDVRELRVEVVRDKLAKGKRYKDKASIIKELEGLGEQVFNPPPPKPSSELKPHHKARPLTLDDVWPHSRILGMSDDTCKRRDEIVARVLAFMYKAFEKYKVNKEMRHTWRVVLATKRLSDAIERYASEWRRHSVNFKQQDEMALNAVREAVNYYVACYQPRADEYRGNVDMTYTDYWLFCKLFDFKEGTDIAITLEQNPVDLTNTR